MKSFPIVIMGGGVVAGYAAKEFVAPRWILRRPRLDPDALQNARHLKSLDATFGRQD